MLNLIIAYLIFINTIGFLIMGLDKYRAKHQKWRISEKMLFSIALMGGSFGSLIGMIIFHHKTKHWNFLMGMPLIFLVQIFLIIYKCLAL